MLERVLIAGSGGQGVVLIGRLLANVAVETIQHVTFFPSYGAEVRGGTSSCQVILSSNEIASPLSDEPDSLILMDQQSLLRFAANAKEQALIVVNTSLCRPAPGTPCSGLPATELASKLGDDRVANFIMLGAYVARRRIIAPSAIRDSIRQLLLKKGVNVVDCNIKAFNCGLDYHA
jgi:2-oxoglutarate ferredoxin oxidoreductase subunit gamma